MSNATFVLVEFLTFFLGVMGFLYYSIRKLNREIVEAAKSGAASMFSNPDDKSQ
jgi:hypothetical protein